MELKVKVMKWGAGSPVAMLNNKTAEKFGVTGKDRVILKKLSKNSEPFITIIDTIGSLVSKDEVAVSLELKERMSLENGQMLDVSLAENPKSLVYIKNKLNKKVLSEKEIWAIIQDVVDNSLSEAEIALFVSAMYRNGMNFQETVSLIKAILRTGDKLDLKGKYIVDKHSIGGIPNNRTTPIVVSICAAAGLIFPKNSSRAITSPAGTSDVIETLAKVDFTIKEMKEIITKTGACMVWGGALEIVPADSRIIQIEKELNIDPESQLLASIMSKKLASSANYILIDIPFGKNAKVSKEKALHLKKKFLALAKYFKKKMRVVLTNGNEPIGNGVGPNLEMIDIIKILNPKEKGPEDLEKKSIFLASQIFEMTGKTKIGKGEELAREILESGKAFDKFKEIIEAQKGKVKQLYPGKFKKDFLADKSGKIIEIDNKKISMLARIAGCPQNKLAGIYIYKHTQEKISKGEKILTVFSETKSHLQEAIKYYDKEKPITIK